jgi:shikimate dehydrogenase
MRLYGLIGFPLSHSFSARYFEDKFARERITDCGYRLFPLEDISGIRKLILDHRELHGFNVTIPHKIAILPFLDTVSDEAAAVGAVNCVKIERNGSVSTLTGYNTDVYGFRESLLPFLKPYHRKALVLGTGGAAKAACYVLEELGIDYTLVSRSGQMPDSLSYPQLTENMLRENLLIVNTTPLGMYPDLDRCPEIPYSFLTNQHLLFDLVYNPAETTFLKRGREAGTATLNGLKMLELQAEKSWEIWNG